MKFSKEKVDFSPRSVQHIFFLDYITNKTESDWNKTETVAQIKVSMAIIFKNNKIKPIHSLVGSTAFPFIFWLYHSCLMHTNMVHHFALHIIKHTDIAIKILPSSLSLIQNNFSYFVLLYFIQILSFGIVCKSWQGSNDVWVESSFMIHGNY